MDHQVKNDIDIGAAGIKWCYPVRFDEQGFAQGILQCQNRRVKPLKVADLQDTVIFLCQLEH